MHPVRFILSAVIAAAASVAFAQPASAAPVNYVALGDSYSSGVGTGSYIPSSGGCKRSNHAFPALWAAARGANLSFVACSGARTADVTNNQVGALSAATTLATVQVGGNDAGFTDVITTCTMGSDQDCVNRTNQAKTFVQNQLPARLDGVYTAVRTRAPNARVVVVGYPRLYKVPGACSAGLGDTKRAAINSASDALSQVISARAAARSFTYVDVRGAFGGHEICSSDWWINSLSWPVEESYHPNRNGQAKGYLPQLSAVTG